MKILSVIISARHASPFLEECIRSIRLQTLPSGWTAEVLVGVDACERTASTVSSLVSHSVKAFYFRQSLGPYGIFNRLAARARGEALARFDADDIMLQGHLAGAIFSMFEWPRADIVRSWSVYVDERLKPSRAELGNGTHTPSDGVRSKGSDGQFVMTRRVWDRLGSFREWRCHADSEFLDRARLAGFQVFDVREVTYVRRVHPACMTLSDTLGYRSDIRKEYALFRSQQRSSLRAPPPLTCALDQAPLLEIR